jgi:hypothetical protein
MTNALGENSWWLVATDNDKKTFSIAGPILDDTEVNNKVADLNKKGRNIQIQTVSSTSTKREILIKDIQQYGLKYVEENILTD